MTARPFRLLLVSATLLGVSLAAGTRVAAQVRVMHAVTADAAERAIAAAAAEARKQGWLVSISVVDNGGELVAFLRMDDAPPSSVDISRGKARTAARMRRATRVLDSTLTAGRLPILGIDGIVPVEGGVPIIVNGEVVGAVGVSGATSAQDAQVARAGVATVK